jgi:hypothetical protein
VLGNCNLGVPLRWSHCEAIRESGDDSGYRTNHETGCESGHFASYESSHESNYDSDRVSHHDPGRRSNRKTGRKTGNESGRESGHDSNHESSRGSSPEPNHDSGHDSSRELSHESGHDTGPAGKTGCPQLRGQPWGRRLEGLFGQHELPADSFRPVVESIGIHAIGQPSALGVSPVPDRSVGTRLGPDVSRRVPAAIEGIPLSTRQLRSIGHDP